MSWFASRHVFALGLALVAALLAATASRASAEDGAVVSDVARAESYAAEAFDAFTAKDYAKAVSLYRRALDASPSADITYNLARIYDTKLNDRTLAIDYYARYTEDSRAEPSRLRIASERLTQLRELETVSSRAVSARASTPPDSTALASAPSAPSAATANPSVTPPRTGGLSGLQLSGLLIGTVGLTGIGFGTGFGLAARSHADVAHGLCDGNACMTQRGVDSAKRADRAATISTVSFIAGGSLLAVGITLLVLGSLAQGREAARLRVVPVAAVGGLGAQLSARW